MLTPWQLLIWWFIAAKHVYMGVRACAIGLARSPCQLYLPYPFHDVKKISYLIDCTAFNGVHVHWGNTWSESIHNNCRQNQYKSLKGKSPKIPAGLAVPSHRSPKNPNGHIYSFSGRHASQCWDLHLFSLRILTIFLQFIRSKSKMATGVWNIATVDILGIHLYYIWILGSTEMIFMI